MDAVSLFVTRPANRLVVRYPALAVLAELPRLRLPVVSPETLYTAFVR